MNNKLLESREVIFCPSDDRIILVIKENDDIVGLNYMQGDDLDYSKHSFFCVDTELTDFFNAIEPYLVHDNEVDKINAAIWAHFEFRNLRDSRKAL